MFIQVKKINKTFGSKYPVQALNNVSLTVEEGGWLTIMGPSGSGKTTLLNIIGGMETLDDGELEVDGRQIARFSYDELQTFRREMIGFVFQHYQLFDQYTVLENVMIPQWPYQDLSTIKQKAKEILTQLHMKERMNHLPGELSGGEKQRTAIARALINDPKILLCDEPTGNLDADNRDNIMGLLQQLHKNGMTILIVTHDTEVAKYGARELYLRDGNLVENVHEV